MLYGLTQEQKASFLLLLLVNVCRLRESFLTTCALVQLYAHTLWQTNTPVSLALCECAVAAVSSPLCEHVSLFGFTADGMFVTLTAPASVNWTGTMKTWRQWQCTLRLLRLFLLPYVQKLQQQKPRHASGCFVFYSRDTGPCSVKPLGGLNFDLWQAAIQSWQTLPSAQHSWWCTVDLLSTCKVDVWLISRIKIHSYLPYQQLDIQAHAFFNCFY